MKKNKKLLIQPALLATALVAAGLLTPPPVLALTLKPLDGGSKKHTAAPTSATARPAAHPVAARPGTLRPTPATLKKPLAAPGLASSGKKAATVRSPAAAARKPILTAKPHAGGQLLVIMRSGTKLTPTLLATLSQAAHSRLSPVQYYGSGEYILRAQGVSNLAGLKTAAARLHSNPNILRAYAYKNEKPLYLKVQAKKNYVLLDPYLNHRTAAGVPSALTLMPKQIIGVRVPLRMVRAASRALKTNTTLPTGMFGGFLAAVPGANLYDLATQHPTPSQPMVYNYPSFKSLPIPVALNEADMPSTLGISKGSWNLIGTGMVNFPATVTWGAGKSSGTKAVSNASDTASVPVDAPTAAIIRDVPLLDPNDPSLADKPDNLVAIPPGLTNAHFPTIDFKNPTSSTSSGTPQAVIAPDPLPIVQFPPEALGYAPNSDQIISWPQIPTGAAADPMPVVTFPPSLIGGTPGSSPGAGQTPGQATPPDNSFGVGLPQPGDGSSPSPSTGSAPDPSQSSGSSPTAAAPGTPSDSNAPSGGTDTSAPPPGASAGTPPAAPGIATGADQGLAPDPSATPPADMSGGGMMGGAMGGMMGASVRSARRAAAITPAEKSLIAHWASYMYAIKQNAIIGYHVPTIDSAGVAHGRDIYLQVMKPRTAAPAKTAARKPLAKAPSSHQPAAPAAKPVSAAPKPAPAAPKPASGSIFGGHGSLVGG